MSIDLTTTNALLAVLATVAALEAIAVAALFVCAYVFYRRVMSVLAGIEERQVAPVATRVRAILDDIHVMTTKIKVQAEQVERFVRWASNAPRERREDQEDAGRF